jgi:transcriptional regulator
MYILNAFRADDAATLVEFMSANSFATLVSMLDGAPVASHIPLIVASHDGVVKLSGHLARANPHWKAFGGESLAIFTGPHAYIAPALYEKRENVPTWNYIAVHAYGTPQIVTSATSRAALDAIMNTMFERYDPSYARQWSELSETFRDGMLKGIVGFEMIVTRLEGKYKLSQNRSRTDQRNVAHALLQSDDPTIRGVGEAMRQNLADAGQDAAPEPKR